VVVLEKLLVEKDQAEQKIGLAVRAPQRGQGQAGAVWQAVL